MKNKFVTLVGLSILLSSWLALAQASHSYVSESKPGSVKTVTLRIEDMT
jgi:hypothetical protein